MNETGDIKNKIVRSQSTYLKTMYRIVDEIYGFSRKEKELIKLSFNFFDHEELEIALGDMIHWRCVEQIDKYYYKTIRVTTCRNFVILPDNGGSLREFEKYIEGNYKRKFNPND